MDLSSWSEKDFHESLGTLLLLRMGAKPYRCEYCRVNFASFRSRKEKFSYRRRRTGESRRPEEGKDASAPVGGSAEQAVPPPPQ